MNIKKGIDKACNYVMMKLKEHSRPIQGHPDIKSVATISSGNDSSIGNMIAEAFARMGPDGVLSIELSNCFKTTLEVTEGMEIDRGYISPQFITNSEKSLTEYDNCRVLVTDEKITEAKELVTILEKIKEIDRPLLIIAEDIVEDALATIVMNKIRGNIQVVGVRAPGFGERRKSLLQDIAIVTGAEYIANDIGMKVYQASLNSLGNARKVIVSSHACTIIADHANREKINLRIAQIKNEIHKTDNDYDMKKLLERIAKLAYGIAVIKVGGFTEFEQEDRKLRIEDARNATFAAIEEGIVPGGGTALLHLSELLPEFKSTLDNEEERLGVDIVAKALLSPCRMITHNAGFEGDIVVEEILGMPFDIGCNAMVNKIENMMEKGIIDPVKVTRNALQNSCSIAGLILTTQAVMFNISRQEPKTAEMSL
jgi:chaperonin GroL